MPFVEDFQRAHILSGSIIVLVFSAGGPRKG